MIIDNSNSNDGKGLPRKITAVGTIGEANQLFTVYEKNWHCPGLFKCRIVIFCKLLIYPTY